MMASPILINEQCSTIVRDSYVKPAIPGLVTVTRTSSFEGRTITARVRPIFGGCQYGGTRFGVRKWKAKG